MSNNKSCTSCYYHDSCKRTYVCKYYDPLGDEAEDDYINEQSEFERDEYYDAWVYMEKIDWE